MTDYIYFLKYYKKVFFFYISYINNLWSTNYVTMFTCTSECLILEFLMIDNFSRQQRCEVLSSVFLWFFVFERSITDGAAGVRGLRVWACEHKHCSDVHLNTVFTLPAAPESPRDAAAHSLNSSALLCLMHIGIPAFFQSRLSSSGALPAAGASAGELDYGSSSGKSGRGTLGRVQRERLVSTHQTWTVNIIRRA